MKWVDPPLCQVQASSVQFKSDEIYSTRQTAC